MERKKKIKQHREKKSLNIVQVYYLCQALCPLIRSLILSYMLRIDPFFFFRFSLLWLLSFGLLLCKLNEIKTMQPFCVFYLSKGKHTQKKWGIVVIYHTSGKNNSISKRESMESVYDMIVCLCVCVSATRYIQVLSLFSSQR